MWCSPFCLVSFEGSGLFIECCNILSFPLFHGNRGLGKRGGSLVPTYLFICLGCSWEVHPGGKHCWVHSCNLNDRSLAALWPRVCSWASVTQGGGRLPGKPRFSLVKATVAVCGSVWPLVSAEGVQLWGAVALNTGINCCINHQTREEERRVVQDVEQHLQPRVAAALGCPLDSL